MQYGAAALTRPLSLVAALAALLAIAPAASAGEPTMPLSDVRAGMHCTARSVIQGTTISTFDADVLDVVAGDRAMNAPRILIRVSGPAVDATGIAQGFSGSPVSCPGADGTERVIGAISEGLGDWGNDVVLATPIEAVLGEPVDPPAAMRSGPAAARITARARPLSAPLSVGGLSAPVGRAVQRLASRAGRSILVAPAAPRGGFAPAPLVPGASMAVGYATGDLTAGAVGTVSYVDGDRVWGFGHSLDAVGRRALFLQDAYVYGVIGNPLDVGDITSYKLAAPGHEVGTLSGDGLNAVAGRLGAAPPSVPLEIVARDLDRGVTQSFKVKLADERSVGFPAGFSALAEIAPIAVAQAAFTALGSAPARQTGEMCFRARIREAKKPLRFCNRYVGGAGGAEVLAGAAQASDVGQAARLLQNFEAREIHVERVHITLKLRRGLQQAFLVGLQGPRKVRRARTVQLRAKLRRAGGAVSWRTIPVRIPKSTRRGLREIVLAGTPADDPPSGVDLASLFEEIFGAPPPAETVSGLAQEISALHRFDGVRAGVVRLGGRLSGGARVALQPKDVRISGAARLLVRVR